MDDKQWIRNTRGRYVARYGLRDVRGGPDRTRAGIAPGFTHETVAYLRPKPVSDRNVHPPFPIHNSSALKTPRLGIDHSVRIGTNDIDRAKRATLPALVRHQNEAAMQNVLALNLSVWDLEPEGISWVLLKQRFTVRRLPALGESLRIVTYPAGFRRAFTYRDYRIFDASGNEILSCASQWLLLDLSTREMTLIPDHILARAADLPPAADCLPQRFGRLPRADAWTTVHQNQVRHFDLDWNDHLNNATYLRWLLEALPPGVLSERVPAELEIHYRREARLGDVLPAQFCALPESGTYRLRLSDGATVFAEAWVRMQ